MSGGIERRGRDVAGASGVEGVQPEDAAPAAASGGDRPAAARPPTRRARSTGLGANVLEAALAGAGAGGAAAAAASPTERRVTSFRFERAEDDDLGVVRATIGGKERVLDRAAGEAWELGGGRYMAWHGGAGSGVGGNENEGQALRICDARTGEVRELLSEHYSIDNVEMVTGPGGRDALIVSMSDGASGFSYAAVVDPERGEVARFDQATIDAKLVGGKALEVGYYADDDSGKIVRRERVDLAEVLARPPMANAHDGVIDQYEDYDAAARGAVKAMKDGSRFTAAGIMLGLLQYEEGFEDGMDPAPDRADRVHAILGALKRSKLLDDFGAAVASGEFPGSKSLETSIRDWASPADRRVWDAAVAAGRGPR